MNKTAWGVLIGIGAFLAIVASVWAATSYWHEYCATEVIHETQQDENIGLAMKQSSLAIIQQRMAWLEQRIWEMESEYKCPDCSGSIKRSYDKYVEEYNSLQIKIQKLTES